MRTWALIGLLTVGCDDKDTEGAPPAPDTTPVDTTVEDTVVDSGDTDDTDDTTVPEDTGADDTGSDKTDDTAVVDTSPCEGREVGIQVGQCALDFTLLDQNGDYQTLYDYAGRAIMLDFSGFT